MAIPPSDPIRLLQILTAHAVPFVVIGGHAVIHHGYLRTTEDTDIVFLRSTHSELALLSALQAINACWVADEIDPATGLEKLIAVNLNYIQGKHIMLLWTDLGFLDIFDYIPGFPQNDVHQLFENISITQGIPFVARDWLLKMKQAAGRPKDRDDIENLQDEL